MKKKILTVTLPFVLILAIMVTPVLAKDNQTNGTPFDEIWAAIKALQQQTDVSYGEWKIDENKNMQDIPPNTWYVIPFDEVVNGTTLEGFDIINHTFITPATGIYNITANFWLHDYGKGNIRMLQIISPAGSPGNVYSWTTINQQPVYDINCRYPLYSITWTGRLDVRDSLQIRMYHDSDSFNKLIHVTNLHITKLHNLE